MRHEMDKIEDRHVLSFSATKTELGSFDTGIPSTCQKEKPQVVEITGLKTPLTDPCSVFQLQGGPLPAPASYK